MKRSWLVLTLLCVAMIATACSRGGQTGGTPPAGSQGAQAPTASVQVPSLNGRELKIGSDTTYPPFETVDAEKKIIGFDPDLMAEICKRANCKATFVTAAFDGIFAALAQGQYDAVVSGVTITEERKKTVDFSESYLRYGQVVLVREGETGIAGVDALGSKTIAVQTGTTNDEKATALQKEGKAKDVKRYDTFDLAVRALLNKDVDAVIIDSYAADGYIGTNAGKLKKVGEPFTSEDLGIAMKKGDSALKAAIDAALAQMKADGTLDKLYKTWFVERAPGK